jgi:hypothetical protein
LALFWMLLVVCAVYVALVSIEVSKLPLPWRRRAVILVMVGAALAWLAIVVLSVR